MARELPERSAITDDTPLRLEVAARLAFPDGSMSASGLRKERERGRLVTMMIARKEYTTLSHIERMKELCLSHPRARASGRKSGAATKPAKAASRTGSSETGASNAALASALRTAESLRRKPKKRSSDTSSKSTDPRASADVVPMPSRSPT